MLLALVCASESSLFMHYNNPACSSKVWPNRKERNGERERLPGWFGWLVWVQVKLSCSYKAWSCPLLFRRFFYIIITKQDESQEQKYKCVKKLIQVKSVTNVSNSNNEMLESTKNSTNICV